MRFSIKTFCSVPVALPSCAALCCNVSTRVFHGSFILNYEDYRSFRKKELCWTVNGQCLHQFNHLIAIFCGPVLPFTSSAALSGRPVGTAPDIWVIRRKFTTIIEIVKQELCWRNDALQYDNFISSIMTFRAVDLLRSSLIDASSIFDFHLAAVRNSNNQRNAFKSTVSAVISIIRQSARYLDQLSVWNALANCPETAPSASITTWNCPGNGTELNNKKNIKFHRSIDWNGDRWLAHRAPNGGKFNRILIEFQLNLKQLTRNHFSFVFPSEGRSWPQPRISGEKRKNYGTSWFLMTSCVVHFHFRFSPIHQK